MVIPWPVPARKTVIFDVGLRGISLGQLRQLADYLRPRPRAMASTLGVALCICILSKQLNKQIYIYIDIRIMYIVYIDICFLKTDTAIVYWHVKRKSRWKLGPTSGDCMAVLIGCGNRHFCYVISGTSGVLRKVSRYTIWATKVLIQLLMQELQAQMGPNVVPRYEDACRQDAQCSKGITLSSNAVLCWYWYGSESYHKFCSLQASLQDGISSPHAGFQGPLGRTDPVDAEP